MVATSKVSGALGAIGASEAGGEGIAQAVSAVTRASVSGHDMPACDHVPATVFSSWDSRPSKVPPIPGIAMRTVPPCRETSLTANACPP